MSKAFESLMPDATEEIRPFHISVPQEAIADLRARLRATRFPNEQPVKDWSQGVPLAQAEALVQYWESRYDWRRFETELNSFQHFRTLIDGLGIHFIHARSPHTDALPIILTHGWPGSIAEFIKIIRPLTNPTDHGGRVQDAFHVVVPSLPGFGFSDKPTETGCNVSRIAFAWSELMQRLGYQRWVAQGGDWGAGTTTALAQIMPPGLVGIHLSWQFVFPEQIPEQLSFEEKRAVEGAKFFLGEGNGYFRQQSTRPQTVGYGLADSPAGQALDLREIPGVDGQQRPAGRRAFDGSNVGQHFDLLVYQLRRFFGPHLLGESRRFLLWRKGHPSRCGQRISARNIPRT